MKFGRGGLRPNDERGVFVSGSTRDDGCSKFVQKVGSTEYTKEYITSYFLAKKLLLTTTCTITTSLFRNKMFMLDEMT